MKKISTLILFLFTTTLIAVAQNPIPNPSFENWRTYTGTYGSGDVPTGWQTSDSAYINASFGTSGHSAVKEATVNCNLLYSIKLTTITGLGLIGPGVATNGTITGISTVAGGSPDTVRHAQF